MNNFGTCRSCGVRIVWIKTVGGKAMPCNAQPITFQKGGGPETFVTPEGKVERGKRDPDGDLTGYISHFATCPYADRHRRPG